MLNEPAPGAGHKCRVCSMPFAAELTCCPSCAYDRRAAAQAGATSVEATAADVAHVARTGRAKGLRWWKARR